MANTVKVKSGAQRRQQNFVGGAATLVIALFGVKLLGAVYKIFINRLFQGDGSGYFNTAYDIYTPFYAIALAGLPVALSKLVAGYAASGRYKDLRAVQKVARRAYFVTGTISFVVLLLATYPFLTLTGNMRALPCILFIAPSLLFCCVMSSYRGYYNGMHNMVPTALSQIVEALGRVILGLVLAYGTNSWLTAAFNEKGTVFGKVITEGIDSEGKVISAALMAQREIVIYIAAAAIAGVTLGAALGALFMVIYSKRRGDGLTEAEMANAPRPARQRDILKLLAGIAVPVVIGSLVTNASGMIDSIMVQRQLTNLMGTHGNEILAQYAGQLSEGLSPDRVPVFLYGCYKGFAYSIYNLVPTLAEALAVSALTTLAALWVRKERKEIRYSIESTIRITALIAMPAGVGISVLAGPLMSMIYSNPGEVSIATPLLRYLGIAAIFAGLTAPLTSMLQAIGKQHLPVINMCIGMALKIGINYMLVGNPSVNIQGAAIGSLVCYGFIAVTDFICLCVCSGVTPNLLGTIIKPAVCAALCGAAAWATHGLLGRYLSSATLCTAGGILAAALVYLLAVALTRTLVREDVLMLPGGEKMAKGLAKLRVIG